MQLARQPPALGLLGADGAPGAVTAFGLQPLEHLVERLGQLAHVLRRRPGLQARPGGERVDGAHEPGQALQRRERAPDEHEVGGHGRDDPREQHQQLVRRESARSPSTGPSARARKAMSNTAELTQDDALGQGHLRGHHRPA